MSLGRFAFIVLAVVALSASVTLFVGDLAIEQRVAALYGTGVATANTLTAFALMRWAEHRSTKAFLTVVFGGMGVRMAVVLVAVLLAVTVFELPSLAVVVGLLGHFVVFLVLEMIAVQSARLGSGGIRPPQTPLAGAR